MATKFTGDRQASGTPTSHLLSIACTIVVFALAEIQNSFILGDVFSMRFVLMSYMALGLTLAFFWKRLERGPYLKLSSGLYLFGLWVSLFVSTLTPIFLERDLSLVQRTLFQQFGLGFVALSGVTLILGLLQKQTMSPGLMMSALGALGLVATSGGSFFVRTQQDNPDLISSFAQGLLKESASREGKGREENDEGEEIVAHKPEDPHGHLAQGIEKIDVRMKLSAKAVADDAAGQHHEPAPAVAHESADDRDGAEEAHHEAKKLVPKAIGAKGKAQGKKVAGDALAEREGGKDEVEAVRKVKPKDLPVRWSYDQSDIGPAYWGGLSEDFRSCSVGKQQSPIDIPSSGPLLSDVTLDYRPTSLSIVDNGHTIQFNVGQNNSALIGGRRFKLLSIDVHAPSEHWLDGRLSPMEIHFIHKDERNRMAVIAVLVEPGKEQKTFGSMWGYVPQGLNLPASPRNKLFNVADLIPSRPKVYRYSGSLTSPPCSENVSWNVSAERIQLSAEQIEAFKTRYKNNARPLQKREGPAH